MILASLGTDKRFCLQVHLERRGQSLLGRPLGFHRMMSVTLRFRCWSTQRGAWLAIQTGSRSSEPVGTPGLGRLDRHFCPGTCLPARPSGWPTFRLFSDVQLRGHASLPLWAFVSRNARLSGKGRWGWKPPCFVAFLSRGESWPRLSHSFFQTLLISEASPARLLCFKHFLSCYFLELLIFNQLSFVMNDTSKKNVP